MKARDPDFICIGVQRAGTSWLYQCMLEHPEIYMPRKEMHFFDLKYENGIDWYRQQFGAAEKSQAVGEITPDYIYKQESIQRIHEAFPNTKLLVILRNPYERAISAAGLLKSHGRYENCTFREIFEKEPWIIEQSLYNLQLSNVYRYFDSDMVQIFSFEDVRNQPIKLLRAIFKFLDIEETENISAVQRQFNVSNLAKIDSHINITKLQNALNKHKMGKLILKFKKTRLITALKDRLTSSQPIENTDVYENFSLSFVEAIEQDMKDLNINHGIDVEKWQMNVNKAN